MNGFSIRQTLEDMDYVDSLPDPKNPIQYLLIFYATEGQKNRIY